MERPFLVVVCFLFLTLSLAAEPPSCETFRLSLRTLYRFHYQPVATDSIEASEILRECMYSLDPDGLYFRKSDLTEWESEFVELLDTNTTASCQFTEALAARYLQRVMQADSLLGMWTSWTAKEVISRKNFLSLQLPDETTTGTARWEAYWRYHLSEQIGWEWAQQTDSLENPPPLHTWLATHPETWERVLAEEKCRLEQVILTGSDLEAYVLTTLLQTTASRFDPHSAYFTHSERDALQTSLSRDALSFGIEFYENDRGELLVDQLTPGGPAWESNQLHDGDQLIALQWPDETPVDLTCFGWEEVDGLLNDPAKQKVILHVRKRNGREVQVTLIKKTIENADNTLRGFLLEGSHRIGYIALPSFYTEWETDYALGCANDLAKELVKFQREGMEGLIIDLRYNGGGSMSEALELAGIFINMGPLCIMDYREEKPFVIKDPHRGAAYTGPLVLLVNGYSASASELLAGVLQDYGRAVIVGSRTYGKGTAQNIFPVGEETHGYLKITTNKFYRINKSTHQQKGIVPDVSLPELYAFYLSREEDETYALSSDSVVKKVYNPPVPAALPLEALRGQSTLRLKGNPGFNRIRKTNEQLQQTWEEQAGNWQGFQDMHSYVRTMQAGLGTLEEIAYDSTRALAVQSTGMDREVMQINDFERKITERIRQELSEDIYIQEACFILSDLITKTQSDETEE